jgi:hypothetical protein
VSLRKKARQLRNAAKLLMAIPVLAGMAILAFAIEYQTETGRARITPDGHQGVTFRR